MSLIDRIFGRRETPSASAAKERLQLIIAHSHSEAAARPQFLPELQRELMAVLAKYLNVDEVDAQVSFENEKGADMLKIDVLMNGAGRAQSAPSPASAPGTRAPFQRHPNSRKAKRNRS